MTADVRILLGLRLRMLLRPKQTNKKRTGRGTGARLLLQGLLVLGVCIFLAVILGKLLGDVIDGPNGRLLLPTMLAWVSASTSMLLFLASVPVVLAAFTYNSDLKLLLLTPLSPVLILGEKFIWLSANVAVPLLVAGSVVLVSISRAISLSIGYDLMVLPVLVVLPIAPFSLAMLLTVTVMRWVPPARARTITSLLSAMFGIGAYLGTRALDTHGGAQGAQSLRRLLRDTSSSWWTALPTSWPGRALAAAADNRPGESVAYLGGSLLVSAALAGLAIGASARILATGWATYQEVGRKPRRRPWFRRSAGAGSRAPLSPAFASGPAAGDATAAASETAQRIFSASHARAGRRELAAILGDAHASEPRGAVWQLLHKEWRAFHRDPQVWARLLYPMFIVGFGLYQGGNASVVSAGLLVYVLSLMLALPIVNREGHSLYLLALAPISARQIVLAKWLFCAAPVLVFIEGILLVSSRRLAIGASTVILIATSFAGLVVALTGLMLAITLYWPRLDWDTPARQVSGVARIAGLLGGIALCACIYTLLILTLVWRSSRPVESTLCGVGIYGVLALTIVVTAAFAPRRLRAMLHQ